MIYDTDREREFLYAVARIALPVPLERIPNFQIILVNTPGFFDSHTIVVRGDDRESVTYSAETDIDQRVLQRRPDENSAAEYIARKAHEVITLWWDDFSSCHLHDDCKINKKLAKACFHDRHSPKPIAYLDERHVLMFSNVRFQRLIRDAPFDPREPLTEEEGDRIVSDGIRATRTRREVER